MITKANYLTAELVDWASDGSADDEFTISIGGASRNTSDGEESLEDSSKTFAGKETS